MSQFCILCVGSHGDIRPCLALGVKLKAQGHQVRIATQPQMKALCQSLALEHVSVGGNVADGNIRLGPYLSSLDIIKQTRLLASQQLEDSWKAVQGSDVLIYNNGAIAGGHLAEKLSIPSFRLYLQPDISTKHIRPSFLPFPFGYFAIEQLCWQSVRIQVNVWRQKQLGLRQLPLLGPSVDPFCQKIPALIAFSPTLLARPSDWSSHIHMTGFLRLLEGKDWTPQEALKCFLADGPPPVYLGFGSFSHLTPSSILNTLLSILETKGIRCIVQGRSHSLKYRNLFFVDHVPHDWLFPRMCALIHHGGVGTMAEGLYAGKPTLVIPHIADQYFWGKKIHEWGLGPQSLPITQFSSDRFQQCLRDLLSNCSYKRNTASIMSKLHSEPDGVSTALKIISQ